MIDDLLTPWTQKIREAVANIQEGPIRYLRNSRYHYDHGGSGATSTIVAHKNVRKRLVEGRKAGIQFIEGPQPLEALPVITFDKNLSFHWNGETIDLVHIENMSHTDGDSVIFFRDANVVHTGDLYLNINTFPVIDRDVGGDATDLRDNIRTLLEMINNEFIIIPGHGRIANKKDLQKYYKVVTESIAFITKHKAQGESAKEIKK